MDLPHVVLRAPGSCSTFEPVHPHLSSLQLQVQVDVILDHLVPVPNVLLLRTGRGHGGHGVVLPPGHALPHSFHAQVEQLGHAEGQRDHGRHQHEPDDDRLLRGPGQEAVHLVRAGESGADVARLEGEAVEKVLSSDEQGFQNYLSHEVQDITAKEAPTEVDLPVRFSVLGHFEGLSEEEAGLVVKLNLVLHPLHHLGLKQVRVKHVSLKHNF